MLICVGRLSVRTLTPDLYSNRRNPRQRTIIPEYLFSAGSLCLAAGPDPLRNSRAQFRKTICRGPFLIDPSSPDMSLAT